MKTIATTGKTFKDTIEGNFFYIDKTKYLYKLISGGDIYHFLSRPRRFGKSLTISTFESIFKGEKELFKDLYIGKTDYDFKEYNTLHFDFNAIPHKSAEEFYNSLNGEIAKIARKNNITLYTRENGSMFKEVLEGLYENGKRVVVLVDEYDAPLTDNAFKGKDITDKICEIMKEFFSVLKGSPEYLRFVFITGVTRYAKTGIFSELNNLDDLSMNAEYATALGFTKDEILSYFSEGITKGIKRLDISREEYLERIKSHYDGYKFSLDSYYDEDDNEIYPGSVYNPISLCKFFTGGQCVNFENYWIDTSGTTLLMKMAKSNNFSLLKGDEIKVDFDNMSNLDITSLVNDTDEEKLYYLMFQSGYLTLKTKVADKIYKLDFPNGEVRTSFSKSLCNAFIKDIKLKKSILSDIMDYLRSGDFKSAYINIRSIYAAIPYIYLTKDTTENEYKSSLVSILYGGKYADETLTPEESNSSGDSDIVLSLKDHLYIIEAKKDESPEAALKCLKDKGYYTKYKNSAERRTIHLIGINFKSSLTEEQKDRRLPEERYCEEILGETK